MNPNETIADENGSCVLPVPITLNQWEFYDNFSWWLEGFASILIGSMGIIFNLTTINVLLGSDLAASFFNWLLVCLAVFDNLFLLTGILDAFRNHIGSSSMHDYVFVIFLYPLRSIVMCCSIYMTMILALERYHALATPQASHRKGSLCRSLHTLKNYFKTHWTRVIKYVGPVVIFATIFYIPKLFELRLVKQEMCSQNQTGQHCWFQYDVQLAELRKNDLYILWYLNVTNLLITAAIPLLALAFLNFKIFKQLKRYVDRQPSVRKLDAENGPGAAHGKMQRKDKDMIQQTMVLFAIVILFLLCHILRIILNIEEFVSLHEINKAKKDNCTWLQFWTLVAVPISHMLLQINSSINLFIYCCCNKSFRNVLKSKISGLIFLLRIQRKPQIYSTQPAHELNVLNDNVDNQNACRELEENAV
jgi:hypothetical protein